MLASKKTAATGPSLLNFFRRLLWCCLQNPKPKENVVAENGVTESAVPPPPSTANAVERACHVNQPLKYLPTLKAAPP